MLDSHPTARRANRHRALPRLCKPAAERAIRAKRKVIALLNEQKQAIIHRAVTRGLDPNVPIKHSGLPWLGEIPAHWEIVLEGAMLDSVGRDPWQARCWATSRFPTSVRECSGGAFEFKLVKTLRLPDDEAKRSLLKIGDVLMTEGGDPDKLAEVAYGGSDQPLPSSESCSGISDLMQIRLQPHYLSACCSSELCQNDLLTSKQTTNLASQTRQHRKIGMQLKTGERQRRMRHDAPSPAIAAWT